MSAPLNGCRECACDFTSLRLFDAHRVGVNAYTYSESVAMEPMREDGRRCLGADEMLERGWARNDKGRWFDPEESERARARFCAAGVAPEGTREPQEGPAGVGLSRP